MNTQLISYLYIATITLLFIVCIISTARRSNANQTAGILLVLLYWLFLFGTIVPFLIFTGNIIYLPHLFRTTHIASLIYLPLSYLYISQSFTPRRLQYKDLLHLLPLLIYLVDYFPFFIKTGSEKVAIYQQLSTIQRDISFQEGWFMPPKSHVVIRYVQMIIYWILQFRLLRISMGVSSKSVLKENPDQIKWLCWFTGSQLLIILPPFTSLLLGFDMSTRFLILVSSLVSGCIQCYFLLMHPEILYGIKGAIIEADTPELVEEGTETKNLPPQESSRSAPLYYMSEALLDSIQIELDQYLTHSKPYLKQGFNMAELAKATQFSVHQLSGYINKRCNMNFYSLINQFRINYCKEKFESKEYLDKTLEAIAQESGFQSRSTFIRAFKKSTGLTPTEYIRNMNLQ